MRLRDYQSIRELHLEIIRPDAQPEHVAGLLQGIGADLAGWAGLLNISFENNALPLLYHSLNRLGLDGTIPEQVREVLRKSYLKNTTRNLILQNELTKILRSLYDRGIPVIPLKGAIAFIENIFRDKNVRVMGDLDLLIRRDDRETARQTLSALNYQTEDQCGDDMDKMVFQRSAVKVVEIHFLPAGEDLSPYLPGEEVWSHAVRREKDGIPVLLPSPTDQLYHLLVHEIIQHQRMINYRTLGMYEVYSLLAFYRETIDFETLFQRVRRFNIEELFSIYLLLTEEKMGSILPLSIRDGIRSRAGKSLRWYGKVSRNPLWLTWAGNRFFIVLSTSTGFSSYLKNAYRTLIQESVFLKSDPFLLSLYGLTKLPSPLMPLLKGFHVVRMLSLHLVVSLLFLLRRP